MAGGCEWMLHELQGRRPEGRRAVDKRIKRDLGECSVRLGCAGTLPTMYTVPVPVTLRRHADEQSRPRPTSSRVGGCNWPKENMKAQDRLARMRHNGPDDRPLSSVGSAGWDAKGRGLEEVLPLLPRFEQPSGACCTSGMS